MKKSEWDKLLDNTIELLRSQYEELVTYVINDDRVEVFVENLLYCMDDDNKSDEVKYNQSENIYYDIKSAIKNNYHMQANWIYELNRFIGNYVYDDAYFTLKKTKPFGVWELKNASNDIDEIYHNTDDIIEAALDNAKFYLDVNNLYGAELKNRMNIGVQHSGKVKG